MARQRAPRAASHPVARASAHVAQKAFSSSKAEKWVITSAIISLAVYAVRRLVEGETSPAPSTSAARSFLGSGSPPNLAQWIIAYVVAYGGLSLLAVATPEIAAALAAFVVIATILDSGSQLATDLTNLEHGAALGGSSSQGVTAATTPLLGGSPGTGTAPPASGTFGAAPSPQSVGASVLNNIGNAVRSKSNLKPAGQSVNQIAASEGLHWDPSLDQYVN